MALTPEQQAQIDALKAQYAKAQSSGDKAGMASANQQANAIRNSAGMVAGKDYNPTTGGAPLPQRTITSVPLGQGVAPNAGYITQNGQLTTRQAGDFVASSPVSASNVKQPVPTTTPTTPTTTTTTGGGTTTTTTSPTNEYINKIFEAQQKANVEKFYQARNQAAAQNQQQVRNFAEYMANRGLTGSGAGAQSAISQSGVYQANIGSLLGQEAQAQADIGANQAKASLDQFNTDRNFALQEAGLTGQYQGKETLAGTKARLDNIITEAKASTANAVSQAELKKIEDEVAKGKMDLATATAKAKNIATQIKNENALAVAKINTQNATTTKVGAQTGQAKSAAAASAAAAALSKAKAGQVGKETPKSQKTTQTDYTNKLSYYTSLLNGKDRKTIANVLRNPTNAMIQSIGVKGITELKKIYGI